MGERNFGFSSLKSRLNRDISSHWGTIGRLLARVTHISVIKPHKVKFSCLQCLSLNHD